MIPRGMIIDIVGLNIFASFSTKALGETKREGFEKVIDLVLVQISDSYCVKWENNAATSIYMYIVFMIYLQHQYG